MPYSFKVTAKQNIGGNKGIPKAECTMRGNRNFLTANQDNP